MSEPTHILHWVPPYLNSNGEGLWELQGITDYEAGAAPAAEDWRIEDEDRNLDAGDVTEWIASLVGPPVTTERWTSRITCPRALRFWKREPAFLIAPAEVTS